MSNTLVVPICFTGVPTKTGDIYIQGAFTNSENKIIPVINGATNDKLGDGRITENVGRAYVEIDMRTVTDPNNILDLLKDPFPMASVSCVFDPNSIVKDYDGSIVESEITEVIVTNLTSVGNET